jgi:hypothetical protein
MDYDVPMALDLPAPLFIIVDPVAIERECREAEERHWGLSEIPRVLAFWETDLIRPRRRFFWGGDLRAENPIPIFVVY